MYHSHSVHLSYIILLCCYIVCREAARRMQEEGVLWPSESAGRSPGSAPGGSIEGGFLFDNASPFALCSMDD